MDIIQGNNQQIPQQGQQVSIDIGAQPSIVCDRCGSRRFLHGLFFLKRLSQFVSPTGKAEVVPVGPLFYCESCGHVNDEFVPPALREDDDTPPPNTSNSPLTVL